MLELPDELTLAEGAGVPENFWTVWANLFEPAFGNLLERPAEKALLVHGGAGGIGSTALALASHFGVRTITTVSSAAKASRGGAIHLLHPPSPPRARRPEVCARAPCETSA